jgi:DedD protein
MGLFSFLNKNKQDSAGTGYLSRGDDDDAAIGAKARAKRASHAGEGAARRGKDAADPVLPEKKRARRRLVGAIALAMAVAVGLPMILDSEPKPIATDIDIRIPAKDKTPQVAVPVAETLDRREEIVEPAKALTPPPVADVKEVNLTPARPDSKPEIKPEPKPEVKKPEVKVAEKPAEKTAEKPVSKEASKPAQPKDTERALAILEGKPEAAAPSSQKYVVQVAALASQEKASELQGKLKAAGIPSFTQKGSGKTGELIRVRVGPFSKDEGAAIRAKLDKLGLSGSVVPQS